MQKIKINSSVKKGEKKISLNVNTRKEIKFLFIMILRGYGWGKFTKYI